MNIKEKNKYVIWGRRKHNNKMPMTMRIEGVRQQWVIVLHKRNNKLQTQKEIIKKFANWYVIRNSYYTLLLVLPIIFRNGNRAKPEPEPIKQI